MAAFARKAGVDKVVSKVNEEHFVPLASSFGLEEPVQPRLITAQYILQYVRSMIAPVSSWAAAVSGYVNSESVSGIQMFIKQIPYNYYCLLTIVMMFVISIINLDYGPMTAVLIGYVFIWFVWA